MTGSVVLDDSCRGGLARLKCTTAAGMFGLGEEIAGLVEGLGDSCLPIRRASSLAICISVEFWEP